MTSPLGEELTVELQALTRAAASAVAVAAPAGNLVTYTHIAVQRILSDVLFRCNGRHRLLSLPQALLHRIFGFVRPEEVWSLSQTCRSLRSSCLADHRLWTACPQKFYEASALDVSLLSRQLSLLAERSYPYSFDLDQFFYSMNMSKEDALVCMTGFLSRLRRFYVGPNSHQIYYTALRMLKTPAPLLEELSFNGVLVDIPGICLPSDFLGGEPGRLRSLNLHGIALPLSVPSLPALRNLRSLHWNDTKHLVVDATVLCRILALLPCLETLHLFVRSLFWELCQTELATPHTLTEFWLMVQDRHVESVNVLSFVQHFGIPRFRYTSSAGYTLFLKDLTQQPICVRVGICTTEVVLESHTGQPFTVSGDDGIVTDARFTVAGGHVSPALFSALTQLSMPEFSWTCAHVELPPLPVLHTLRLTLASCAKYSRYWERAPFGILHGFDLAVWDAPALDVVHFDYWLPAHLTCRASWTPPWRVPPATPHRSCRDTPLAISLLDVYEFVQRCLPRAPGRKFAEIRLRGVECVDPDPWPAFDLLQAIADEVSVTDASGATQFDIDDQKLAAQDQAY